MSLHPASANAAAGFSLAEMLVVLAITGMIVGLAAPALRDPTGQRSMERTAVEVASLLREARTQAVLSGADAAISFDIATGRVFADWPRDDLLLLGGVALKVTGAREELVAPAVPSFRFFADGSATGGEIVLSASGIEGRIAVDWLTGRVERRTERLE